jgi:hypothetical protein
MRSLGEFYNECRELGVTSSQKAFSRLWGKQPSWFSSTQARKRAPTTESLVTFLIRLDKIANATQAEIQMTTDMDEREALSEGLVEVSTMRAEIWEEIVARAN